ncbi:MULTISPECIES: ABC transporter permease [unclassified Mycolicibacterium]|uniref:ABC transporter permease n=1 Tax=unclassified Mycolicibacterium TaxID=2636767 RepID=UPI001391DBEA|nr:MULTISPECIES: ABC transporter permease [unclassified Mycolicibacterium]
MAAGMDEGEERLVSAPTKRHVAGPWRLAAVPGTAWLVLLYLVPLGMLVIAAFSQPDFIGHPVFGDWTGEHLQRVLSPMYLSVFVRTVVISTATALICLVWGYAVAFTISMYGGRYKQTLIVVILVPWLVDYLIRIYAWLQLLSDDGVFLAVGRKLGIVPDNVSLVGTTAAVVIGLVYNFLPFAILPLYTALEGVDRSHVEAARDLYASNAGAFRHVVMPATAAGCVSSVMIVFLLTFGDFATAQILGGPKQAMLGNVVQDQFIGAGALPFGAAMTVCVLAVVLALLGCLGLLSSRLDRRFAA